MKRLKHHIQWAIMIAVAIIGMKFAQDVEDWGKLLTYQPAPEIARIAAATKMTDTARRLFYVNQPTIAADKSAFKLCSRSERTIVLGCYVPSQGIFIKSVTDPNLQGIMEVTAAHEMLHVVYQRMSIVEQEEINRKLEKVLDRLQNPRIIKLVQTYNEQDPRSVNNELHSIFGTELRHLSPELEAYYRKYFTDRAAVVAFSERYEGVFTALKEKAQKLNQELTTRKTELERLSAQVEQDAQAVESERSNLETAISTNPQGDSSYLVARFNDRVNSYNQLVSQLKQQTDIYNQLVSEHNTLVLEEQSLVESLESKSTQ
jgi:uncharacterized protein YukE